MNTISNEYREIQKALHQNPNYGVMSVHYSPLVSDIIDKTGAQTLCDYGAGKKRLMECLASMGHEGLVYHPYDPAFPEYGQPTPAELVTCIDVLEHIEPDCLDSVILQLHEITRHFGFFTNHTGPAFKTLLDGRNAHLIQESSGWWLQRLGAYFNVIELQSVTNGFWVLVEPRKP